MPSPNPTLIQVIDGLIAKAKADIDGSGDDLLADVLDTYGVTLDTGDSENDDGEYNGLVFGDVGDLATGLTICFVPGEIEEGWSAAPDGAMVSYSVLIRAYWSNPSDGTDKLTSTRGKHWRCITALSFALAELFGPASLGASSGGWLEDGWGQPVLNPMCRLYDPATNDAEGSKRHVQGVWAELEFTGDVEFSSP